MRTVGFPISDKENEKRRAIVPGDLINYPNICKYLYFEENYGEVLGISNDEFTKIGCHVVKKSELLNCDVIVDPKIGDATYLKDIKNRIIFGWIHATQNKNITDLIIDNKNTAYAWEKMYEEGRHIFWKNNELAGEAAIIHAFQCYGRMPYEVSVAVLGNGNTARGAIKMLNMLGANVFQYNRKTEKLFVKELCNYDVVVNCILWDTNRKDHIIYKSDLKKMKKGSMIIDVSCDRNGGIETSIPTTIESPTYYVDGVLHYVVDHTPSIFYKTFTYNNSSIVVKFIDLFVNEKTNSVLDDALIISNGKIIDKDIIAFQNRKE